jgi:general secretion pathway protein M
MITTRFFDHPSVPALGYAALVTTLLMTALTAGIDIAQHHRAVLESAELLARLEHRTSPSSAGLGRVTGDQPKGSPFLDGQTVTVASAALLQRVTDAISRAGGNVVSSEIAPQDLHSADGFVRIIATCEIEQTAMQGLLYDLEAGMPFLFVDQLLVEASLPGSDSARMRVVLEVSGLWPGAKSK